MVDALVLRGDERRSMAAISFGEVPSNLWSVDVRMGKPLYFGRDCMNLHAEQTQGSKTFQYLEEERPIGISWVAASEKERAQT